MPAQGIWPMPVLLESLHSLLGKDVLAPGGQREALLICLGGIGRRIA
jgi:hypothetical protein